MSSGSTRRHVFCCTRRHVFLFDRSHVFLLNSIPFGDAANRGKFAQRDPNKANINKYGKVPPPPSPNQLQMDLGVIYIYICIYGTIGKFDAWNVSIFEDFKQ